MQDAAYSDRPTATMEGDATVSNPLEGGGDMYAMADRAKEPLRAFLLKHSDPRERIFFLKTQKRIGDPDKAAQLSEKDFVIVVPAFVVQELKLAFEIGFLIFLPFLVIDMVISNIIVGHGDDDVVAGNDFVAVQDIAVCACRWLGEADARIGIILCLTISLDIRPRPYGWSFSCQRRRSLLLLSWDFWLPSCRPRHNCRNKRCNIH